MRYTFLVFKIDSVFREEEVPRRLKNFFKKQPPLIMISYLEITGA